MQNNCEKISSLQNARVKQVVALSQKSSERRKRGLFVVEGLRELLHCLRHGYQAESLYICDDVAHDDAEMDELMGLAGEGAVFHVTAAVYGKMAYREGTEGVLGVIHARSASLKDLSLSAVPLVVVAEGVEKPGNLGAILRSADAANADAVIFCDALTDLYNPNVIRSSIGAVFTVPCAVATSAECIQFLQSKGIQILTAQLQDSEVYYDTDMRCATAIVMGTESTGLTDQWRDAAQRHIRIPMLGSLDSLNVSVSTAILLFEAVRQRMGEKGGA